MLKAVSRGTGTLTHPVQFVVEPARVAHRLPRAIPPPQSGGGRVTIGTLRPLSPLGVLKAEKAERDSVAERPSARLGSEREGGKAAGEHWAGRQAAQGAVDAGLLRCLPRRRTGRQAAGQKTDPPPPLLHSNGAIYINSHLQEEDG